MATEYEMCGQIMYVALNSQGQILYNVAAGFNDHKSSFPTIPWIITMKTIFLKSTTKAEYGPMTEVS